MLEQSKNFGQFSWNKILMSLAVVLMTFAFSCTKKVADTAGDTNTPTTPPIESNEAYSIKVIDAAPKSPRKEMTGKIDGVNIVINYGSPAVKERQILNNLIPYGKVWRSGANEATTFEISKDVMIEGKKLPAGKYGFFTLNNEGTTQIIFNSVHDQWGAYDYDSSKDVLSVIVRPTVSAAHVENMDFRIIKNTVMLVWEKVAIPFEIEAA